jgi:hypothetical protein
VRVLLDAHVSGRRIGRALRRAGHDVLALDSDQVRSRLPDGEVLALAARDERIVVTYNIGDFARLAREWAEAGRSHAGVILVPDPRAGPGSVQARLEEIFAAHPAQTDWVDWVAFLAQAE